MPVRIGAGRQLGDGEYAVHYVIYVGKVAAEIPVVVHIDGLARQDGAGELGDGHVGATPGAIDGEKAQACGRQTIDRRVGVGHQFATLLGGGIERDGVIYPLFGTEGHQIAQAIDRAGGGVDQMVYAVLAAPFQYSQHAGEIAVGIGERIFQ